MFCIFACFIMYPWCHLSHVIINIINFEVALQNLYEGLRSSLLPADPYYGFFRGKRLDQTVRSIVTPCFPASSKGQRIQECFSQGRKVAAHCLDHTGWIVLIGLFVAYFVCKCKILFLNVHCIAWKSQLPNMHAHQLSMGYGQVTRHWRDGTFYARLCGMADCFTINGINSVVSANILLWNRCRLAERGRLPGCWKPLQYVK